MKIRIQGNSIRYRLTRTEVRELQEKGIVQKHTTFNRKNFAYRVLEKEGITALEADFQNDTISLFFPKVENEKWADLERVGYANDMILDNGQTLRLLLEKDFVCLDERVEDQSDNYPNPAATTKK
jgi:repressor of nif and glnA expression